MQFIGWFIEKNQRFSYPVHRSLPRARTGEALEREQDRLVPDLIHRFRGAVVVDIGGGRNYHVAQHLKSRDAILPYVPGAENLAAQLSFVARKAEPPVKPSELSGGRTHARGEADRMSWAGN